jgi:translation initiation factor 2 gamma subunit (eIF-2gamma)
MPGTASAQFYVVGGPRETDLGTVVVGTLFAGVLRVGDRFTICEGPRTRANVASNQRQKVQLGVVEISMFNRPVYELEEAFNGQLVLVGEGADAVQDGVVLHVAPEEPG